MKEFHGVILKPGKDKAIRNRHHWIFSGAVSTLPKFTDGDILPVVSVNGDCLGSGYFNRKSSIIGRMVSFDESDPLKTIEKHLDQALKLRKRLFDDTVTNAYRLVNGEGDCLPGLVVDKYADVIVVQITTLGMDRILPFISDYFMKKLKPRCIYEKSLVPSRKEEGLPAVQRVLNGDLPDEVEIIENSLKFRISIPEGQKTGFFLDHREMRDLVRSYAKQQRVLNCFSYTGAFSVYALAGEAAKVDTVDISEKAIAAAKANVALNGFDVRQHNFYAEDAFQFLREHSLDYNLVILDPPAFAKKKHDVIAACRGYKDINRIAMEKMPANSLLLTCSCSYHVDADLFQKVVFQAAVEAGRTARIVSTHRMAADHPVNLCHPESDYLKSLLVYLS